MVGSNFYENDNLNNMNQMNAEPDEEALEYL